MTYSEWKIKNLEKRNKKLIKRGKTPIPVPEKPIASETELATQIMILDPNTNVISIENLKTKNNIHQKDKTKYRLKPKGLNLIQHGDGFVSHYLFIKNKEEPYDFTNKNKRIPARVLTILYNLDAYRILIQPERKNLNLILVIIGIITLIVLSVYAYINYCGGEIPSLTGIVG